MVSKKHGARVAPKISAAASLSVSDSIGPQPSSVLKGAFAPSVFQLSLFASVIQALDGQQLQVHDTQSNRLLCQHRVSRSRITTLDWGHCQSSASLPSQDSNRKRKRLVEDLNGVTSDAGEVVIGFGTEHSDISFFSPTTSTVTSTLPRTHRGGIKELRFEDYGRNGRAWSLGGDKSLIHWDVSKGVALRTITVPLSIPSTLAVLPRAILIASHDTYMVDLENADAIKKLGHGTNAVHTLFGNVSMDDSKSVNAYIAISTSESQALVYDLTSASNTISALNAEAEIVQATLASKATTSGDTANEVMLGEQSIALATKAATVELFRDPFNTSQRATQSSGATSGRRGIARKATIKVRVCPTEQNVNPYPIAGITFEGDDLVIGYLQRPGSLAFERLHLSELSAKGVAQGGEVVLRRARNAVNIAKSGLISHEDDNHVRVNEGKAVVVRGTDMNDQVTSTTQPEPITISSGEESESDEVEELEFESPLAMNGVQHGNKELSLTKVDGPVADETYAEEEPSFGDLIRANDSKVVNVTAQNEFGNAQGLVPYGRGDGVVSSNLSLGTVLSQALRANDKTLLESCLQEHDLDTVRATIERLDAPLAMILLQRLAEKIYSRPGRSGALMVWVQWTVVSHGGYLASQPDRARKLADLQHVIKARADTLQPLLSLKGKLDMLEAQMSLRRSMQKKSAARAVLPEEAEDAALYVEGEMDTDSENEDGEGLILDSDSADEGDGNTDIDMDSDEMDEMEDAGDGFIDDEAVESDQSDEDGSGDEAVDYDDVDSMDEGSEEEQTSTKRRHKDNLTNGV